MNISIRPAAPLALAAAVLVCAGVSAHAALTQIDYTGQVSQILDPADAFGLSVGDTIHYRVRYDPATLVDVSQTFYNIDAISGLPVSIPGLHVASLSDDPRADVSVTIGARHLGKFSDPGFGIDPGLGVGTFPLVAFDGSTFLGAAFTAKGSDGFVLDTDPIAYILHYFPTQGIGYRSHADHLAFLVTTDTTDAVFSTVPEPAAFALFGLGAAVLLRSRSRSSRCR